MDQPRRSSRLRQGSDLCGTSDRNDGRRASVAQAMAENREGLGMKVIAIMVQRYGVLPREMWDLNSLSDMGAGRGITYGDHLSRAVFESITGNGRYSIVNLTIDKDVSHKVEFPKTLRQLNIETQIYRYSLDPLPVNLRVLIFNEECTYEEPLVLPNSLRKLKLHDLFNLPIHLPSTLVDLEIGPKYDRPLTLPQRLKRLAFDVCSDFNFPVALPGRLSCIEFGDSYNQPTILPPQIEEIRVGTAFTHDLSFPTSLRKIAWCCDRPIQIPDGVTELDFNEAFDQPVILPANLKKVAFEGETYSHPLNLPTGLEEFSWHMEEHDEFALPEGLQKLTWGSASGITLPLGLRELVIAAGVLLVLPPGLLKVKFDSSSTYQYTLPESVQEVRWSHFSPERLFTHPTTLHHLIIEFSLMFSEVDLSHIRVHKLTMEDCNTRMKKWPIGVEELAFTVDDMLYPLHVPKGCRIVGEKRPANVTTE